MDDQIGVVRIFAAQLAPALTRGASGCQDKWKPETEGGPGSRRPSRPPNRAEGYNSASRRAVETLVMFKMSICGESRFEG